MTIIPFQTKFDKGFPSVLGNAEYTAECDLLRAMDLIITHSGIEYTFIKFFLDVCSVEKYICVFGTDQPSELTTKEREVARDNALFALRASVLRKHLRLSLRRFSLAISHSDLYKWFCRINRFATPRVPGKSTIHEYENMIPVRLTLELDALVFKSVQNDTQTVLSKPIDFSQCYLDSTCIQANIHFPVDWVLLRDATRTMCKAIKRIRKLGLRNRMPCEPHELMRRMNTLCIMMTHARRKKGAKKNRKAILRKMKKLVKRVAKHAMAHFTLLEQNRLQTRLSLNQANQILNQITLVVDQLATAIKNAHDRIIGERKVANHNKILSLYEEDVHVIVRHKSGAEVEFGNSLLLTEQQNGLIVDWKLFRCQAPSDTGLLQNSHKRITQRLGVAIGLIAGDRGFDSQDNRDYLETNNIYNAVCPRDPHKLQARLKEEAFRQGQRRRSQTEARISILGRCFSGNPMLQKGFEHREQHLGLSVFSHNIWVLARLKVAQDKQALEQAA